jgi:hypothetical protein
MKETNRNILAALTDLRIIANASINIPNRLHDIYAEWVRNGYGQGIPTAYDQNLFDRTFGELYDAMPKWWAHIDDPDVERRLSNLCAVAEVWGTNFDSTADTRYLEDMRKQYLLTIWYVRPENVRPDACPSEKDPDNSESTRPEPEEYRTRSSETKTEPSTRYYEYVNHPAHYNNYSMEVIDMMVRIWGAENTALFCEMNAFKYRMRMGTKPDNNVHQDLEKEKWYLDKARELRG